MDSSRVFYNCQQVFKCKTVDDLLYLKPYIYDEITFWKNDKIDGGLSEQEVYKLINPIIQYLNNQVFAIGESPPRNVNKPDVAHFHSGSIQNAEDDIAKIQEEVKNLRQGIIENKKRQQGDDYVRNFILQNLDRIDLLLNNYDKIRPHYIELNIGSITFNVNFAYPDCMQYLISLMVSAKGLLGDYLLLTEGYEKIIKPLLEK